MKKNLKLTAEVVTRLQQTNSESLFGGQQSDAICTRYGSNCQPNPYTKIAAACPDPNPSGQKSCPGYNCDVICHSAPMDSCASVTCLSEKTWAGCF